MEAISKFSKICQQVVKNKSKTLLSGNGRALCTIRVSPVPELSLTPAHRDWNPAGKETLSSPAGFRPYIGRGKERVQGLDYIRVYM